MCWFQFGKTIMRIAYSAHYTRHYPCQAITITIIKQFPSSPLPRTKYIEWCGNTLLAYFNQAVVILTRSFHCHLQFAMRNYKNAFAKNKHPSCITLRIDGMTDGTKTKGKNNNVLTCSLNANRCHASSIPISQLSSSKKWSWNSIEATAHNSNAKIQWLDCASLSFLRLGTAHSYFSERKSLEFNRNITS